MGCVLPAVWQKWSVGGVTNLDRIPTKYPTTTFFNENQNKNYPTKTFGNANTNVASKAHNFWSNKAAFKIHNSGVQLEYSFSLKAKTRIIWILISDHDLTEM